MKLTDFWQLWRREKYIFIMFLLLLCGFLYELGTINKYMTACNAHYKAEFERMLEQCGCVMCQTFVPVEYNISINVYGWKDGT